MQPSKGCAPCVYVQVSWPEQSNNDPEDSQNDAAEAALRLVSASSDNTVKARAIYL